jgi:hypothetical protein
VCDALHISDLFGPNSDVGNATAAIQESSGCEFNLWIDRDRIKLPTLDGTSTNNHCSLITANQSPDGIFTATPGSLFMWRNASLAGRTAYVKTTGTENTGSNALLERNVGSTTGRPSLTSTGDRPFFYYNSDEETVYFLD